MAQKKIPDRLYIPPEALAEWHEKAPGLPAFEGVCVGNPCEVYVHEAEIMSDPRVMKLIEALHECKKANRRAFNKTENFYTMLSAVETVVDDALSAIKGSNDA